MEHLGLYLLGGLLLVGILGYNSLISKRNEIENTIGSVHSYLQKRADLIPNLVATVKQYAQHETVLLTQLTELRTSVMKAQPVGGALPNSEVQLDTQLSQAFGRVLAVSEAYPDLKANQNFLSFQASLNEIEGQLAAARRTYNAAVSSYNAAIEKFPTVLIAGAMGYKKKSMFQVSVEVAQKPDVAKLFGSAS